MADVDPAIVRDDALVARLREGDVEALREVMGVYYNRLVHAAAVYLHSQDSAEDAVQTVMVAVWERRAELPGGRELAPYLFGAVRKRAMSVYREQHTRERYHHAAIEPLDGETNIAENEGVAHVELDELSARLEREIDALPPRCREIFRLSRDQGLSYGEIAAMLGISPNTVRVQIAKALDLLRRDLDGWIS